MHCSFVHINNRQVPFQTGGGGLLQNRGWENQNCSLECLERRMGCECCVLENVIVGRV